MTEKDKQLIAQARRTIQERLDPLIEQCDTDEAREEIWQIRHDKYYREKCRMDAY